ncbi:MAG: hypothetical protein ACOYXT_04585 [Bacteroidota bacterium]
MGERVLEKSASEVSVSELRKLLFELKNFRPDIQVRFRLIGEPWHTNFVSITMLTGVSNNFEESKTVVFTDTILNKVLVIQNITNIMQFEIDGPFGFFQPHFHYNVML